MDPKILVIDDDAGLLTLLQLGLEHDGFEVTTAKNGKEGIRKAYQLHPDVIVLDVIMTEMDGWTACQRLRQVCDTPILMLTACARDQDVVKGLNMGADDYLTKPCSFDELKMRIRTLLRREHAHVGNNKEVVYDDGNLRVDLREGTVIRQGELVSLTPIEARLLMHLVSHRDRIVPHEELLASVWGPEYRRETGYLSVYIRYLREKLEDDPADPRYIHTRWKLGYCFVGQEAA